MVACAPPNLTSLGDWQVVSVLAIGIASLFLGLVYMFAEALRNNGMSAWVKVEAGQVMFTLVLFLLLSTLTTTICSLDLGSLFPQIGSGVNYYDTAKLYLRDMQGGAYGSFTSARGRLAQLEKEMSMSEYKCSFLCMLGLASGYSVRPGAGVGAQIGPVNMAMNSLMTSALAAAFQLFVLAFIENGLFQLFLPLGVLLRAMPFMRDFGSGLIGLSLAMYVFYPFMLIVDKVLMGTPVAPSSYMWGAAYYFVGTIFLPAINFIIIIAFTRELSGALGADVDISRLAQMM